jgi:SagB-type dehydrogenase family enzyme
MSLALGSLAVTPVDAACWEVFHENSKRSSLDLPSSQEPATDSSRRDESSFATELYPMVRLPYAAVPIETTLTAAVAAQVVPDRLAPTPLTLAQLATLLYCAYGVTGQSDAVPSRLTRAVPSAGEVYPLDILFHTRSVESLDPGLYHYSPIRHELHRVIDGDQTAAIASALPNRSVAVEATMVLFIVAAFPRMTARFGERGYRHALVEAGHVGQNLRLAATGLRFACLNIGEYFDRKVDELLRLDGVRHSTVSMAAIGVAAAARSAGSADR